jgi:Arc/MetJ family transcription regulator
MATVHAALIAVDPHFGEDVSKTHTTLDLDRQLLTEAAEALGTTRTTETVHAALREVVARRQRARLVRRDFSGLEDLMPEIRAPRGTSAT